MADMVREETMNITGHLDSITALVAASVVNVTLARPRHRPPAAAR